MGTTIGSYQVYDHEKAEGFLKYNNHGFIIFKKIFYFIFLILSFYFLNLLIAISLH